MFIFSKFVVILISLIICIFIIVVAVLTEVIDIFESSETCPRLLCRFAISCHLVGLVAFADCVKLIIAIVISVIVVLLVSDLLLHCQLFFLFLFTG